DVRRRLAHDGRPARGAVHRAAAARSGDRRGARRTPAGLCPHARQPGGRHGGVERSALRTRAGDSRRRSWCGRRRGRRHGRPRRRARRERVARGERVEQAAPDVLARREPHRGRAEAPRRARGAVLPQPAHARARPRRGAWLRGGPGRPAGAAAGRRTRARGARGEGLLGRRMVSGVEVLVGVTRDPTFGPLLVIGAGGVQAELLADTACRPLPVSRQEIVTLLGEVRALGVLRGYRGRPPADVPALVQAIAGLTRLAQRLGARLVSLDANPIVVRERGHGAFAVDLLVELTAATGAG